MNTGQNSISDLPESKYFLFLNPACSFRILLSTILETLASMILQKIMLVSGTRVNPFQFLQVLTSFS